MALSASGSVPQELNTGPSSPAHALILAHRQVRPLSPDKVQHQAHLLLSSTTNAWPGPATPANPTLLLDWTPSMTGQPTAPVTVTKLLTGTAANFPVGPVHPS